MIYISSICNWLYNLSQKLFSAAIIFSVVLLFVELQLWINSTIKISILSPHRIRIPQFKICIFVAIKPYKFMNSFLKYVYILSLSFPQS